MAYKGGARARVGRVGDLATRAAAAGWMGKLGVDGGGGIGVGWGLEALGRV